MKVLFRYLLFVGLFHSITLHSQGVSISATASSPDPSASLDIQSTNRGLLIPRMSTAQRMSIPSPAVGLMVFDIDTDLFWFYTVSTWMEIKAGVIALVSDADGDTKIELEKKPDDDTLRMMAGGYELIKLDGKTLHLNAPGTSILIGKNAGKMDDGTANENVLVGYRAGENTTTGSLNVGVGGQSLYSNIYGSENTAVGTESLFSANAHANTATGYRTLYATTSGNENAAFGYQSLRSNTTCTGNTAIGASVLVENILGHFNTGVGMFSLLNTTGNHNTAIGTFAMEARLRHVEQQLLEKGNLTSQD